MSRRLAEVLARYPSSARPRSEPVPIGNAGGLSGARLWRFDSATGPLLARQWPDGSDRDHVERVARWLKRADRLGFIPVPIHGRDGRSVQPSEGTFWTVEPWKPGSAVQVPSQEQARSAFESLARFHKSMGEITPNAISPGLTSRVGEIDGLIARDILQWGRIVARATPGKTRDLAQQWLANAARSAPAILQEARPFAMKTMPIQPVIRDARPEHILFEDAKVTGMVDFGAMGIDAVSTDFSRLIGEWFTTDSSLRNVAIEAYSSQRPLTQIEESAILIFERTAALLAGARWLRWGFVEPRQFEDPSAIERGLSRAVRRIESLG